MEEEIKKSYYAIIPANVRYDKDITPNAKLLYGEITALCNEKGFCWASNDYFSKLYEVSKVSVSKWINSLIKKGYIESKLIYKENSKEIDKRILLISNLGIKEKFNTYLTEVKDPIKEKLKTPIKEKFKDNSTLTNNTINNTNNIYIEIFDFWNNQGIKNHIKMIDDKYFKDALKENTVEEIKQSILNYKTVLNSDFYFNFTWGLADFLRKQKGKPEANFKRFLNDGDIYISFINQKSKKTQVNKVYKNDNTKYHKLDLNI